MKYDFMKENKAYFPIEKMAQVLKVSRSGYYRWKGNPRSPSKEDRQLLDQIRNIYHGKRRKYGSPRITDELKDQGIRVGKNRVAKLMKRDGLRAKAARKFKVTTNSNHSYPVCKNLLEKPFKADMPNQIWVSDITYIWTREGWLYLAAVLDLFSRQIVGWSMSSRQKQDLVIRALEHAVKRRQPDPGTIIHSDQGSQYASHHYQRIVKYYGLIQSMSHKGNCYDNAVMESFFHTMKVEHIYGEPAFETRNQAIKSIFYYIEIFYNRERKHSSIGYKSPVDFEKGFIVNVA